MTYSEEIQRYLERIQRQKDDSQQLVPVRRTHTAYRSG